MIRTHIALAIGCLALTTASASAQNPSYESRGYGGPLYVGPNFQQGGQWAPPVYGQGSSSSREHARSYNEDRDTPRRERNATKSRKAPATQDAATEKAAPTRNAAAVEKADSENSTISGASQATDTAAPPAAAPPPAGAKAASRDGTAENSTITSASLQVDDAAENTRKAEAAAAKTPVTCKRYIAAVGQTVSVPCD